MQQTKAQEILAMLDAYRCGWIQYDAAHVAQLKKEYAALIQSTN